MAMPEFGSPAPQRPLSISEESELEIVYSHGSLFHAGQCPPPGLYRQVDGPRSVEIRDGERLPASFDGRVACYRRIESTWGQLARRENARAA